MMRRKHLLTAGLLIAPALGLVSSPAAHAQAIPSTMTAIPGETLPPDYRRPHEVAAPAPDADQPTGQPTGAPPSRPAPETTEERALAAALDQMTTDPASVRRIKNAQYQQDEAINEPYGPPAKPVTRSLSVTLRPGEAPPVLHLRYGSVTALTFADLTGQPWDVTGVDGDTESFGMTKVDAKAKTNIITVFPKVRASRGRNLVVSLDGARMPVIFDLNTGGDPTVDYRVDVTVRLRGPNAKSDYVEDTLAPTDDGVMQAFVNDVPPAKAKKLKTTNSSVEAWHYEGILYLRTPYEVRSPGPLRRSLGNISGVHVYAMVDAPTVILSGDDGRTSSVSIGQ